MKDVADLFTRRRSKTAACSLAVLILASVATAGAQETTDATDVSGDTFIPLVSGFELPPEEEESAGAALPSSPEESVSLDKFKEDYAKLKEAISKRLGELSVSSTFDEGGAYEGLPSVDVSRYSSDLEQQAAIKREIDLLRLRVEQAKLASELWATLFPEEEKKTEEVPPPVVQTLVSDSATPLEMDEEVEEDTPQGPVSLLTTSDGWTLYNDREGQVYFARALQDGQPDFTTIKSVEDVMILRAEEEMRRLERRLEIEQQNAQAEASETERRIKEILPSVVAISGVGGTLKARINDTALGLVDVSEGERLPSGISVANISASGVTFRTQQGAHHVGVGVTGASTQ